MAEPEVATEGIQLGPRIAGKAYMRVDISKFVGGNTTFQTLANRLLLPPQNVLSAICAPPDTKLAQLNGAACVAVARAEGLSAGGPAAARTAILKVAHNPSSNDAIFPSWRDAFLGFSIPAEMKPGTPTRVTLPISEKFKNAFERSKTLKVLRPKFNVLEQKTKELRSTANQLELAIAQVRSAAQGNMRELGVLQALILVLDLMLDEKKSDTSSFQKTASQNLKAFRDRLDAFKERANQALVLRPESFLIDPASLARRDQLPARLLELLKAPDFVEGVRGATQNPHLVDPVLWDDLVDTLLRVGMVLCGSPPDKAGRNFAVEFVEQHVIPMIHALIKTDPPQLDAILANAKDPELKAQIKSDWVKLMPAGSGASPYELMALAITSGLTSASNMEGPHSLAVAMMSGAAPALIERSVQALGSGKPVAAVIYRLISRSGNLTRANRVDLLLLLESADLNRFRDDLRKALTGSMFKGVAARGIVALATLAVFAVVLNRDEQLSLKRVSDIVSAGGVAALGLAQSTRQLSTLLAKGAGKITLNGLALIVVVCTAISANEQLKSAELSGDRFAYYEGCVLIGSAGLSLAGWIMVAGLSTSWAGIGEVLMAAGAILAAGIAAFDIVRAILMDGTEKFVKGSMHFLARGLSPDGGSMGPIAQAAAKEASLGAALQALVSTADALVYWPLPVSRAGDLRDRGFSRDAIAAILDVDATSLPVP